MQSLNEVWLFPLPKIRVYGRWWGKEKHPVDGPVIILLHEGLGCVAMWKDFPGLLHEATGLPVFAYDRPGYGRSADLPGGFTEGFLEREADVHLPAILKAAGITGRIIIVGHSDGATAALMAASHPDLRPVKVVSMAPHVIIEPISISGLRFTRKLAADPDFIDRLSKYHGGRTSSLVKGWLDAWLSPWGAKWQMDHYLAKISCPVLFIQGTDDHFGTEQQARHIAGLTGGPLTVKMIDECGHIPHLQATGKVLGFIAEFLQ